MLRRSPSAGRRAYRPQERLIVLMLMLDASGTGRSLSPRPRAANRREPAGMRDLQRFLRPPVAVGD